MLHEVLPNANANMTTIIRFEFAPPAPAPKAQQHSLKRKHELVSMDPNVSPIQFRCDSCLQAHLPCSARKPCGQCLDQDVQCTIDGGKPVKKSSSLVKLSNSPPAFDATTAAKTTAAPLAPLAPRRRPGRPKSNVPAPIAPVPDLLPPQASSSPSPLSSSALSLSHPLPQVAASSSSHPVLQPSTANPTKTLTATKTATSAPAPKPKIHLPATPIAPTLTLKPHPVSAAAPRVPVSAIPPAQRVWTHAKADDSWGRNAEIVAKALALLRALRTHHARHASSDVGVAELRHLLEAPAFVLRGPAPTEFAPEAVAAAAAADAAPDKGRNARRLTDAGLADEGGRLSQQQQHHQGFAETKGPAVGGGGSKRPVGSSSDANARFVAGATAQLAAWIESSRTIDEAVWVLRDLLRAGRKAGADEVPEWMLCQ